MTDPEPVRACPDCEGSEIHPYPHTDPTWVCAGCGNRFDEPICRDARPRANKNPVQRGKAATLDALDADEVGSKHQ